MKFLLSGGNVFCNAHFQKKDIAIHDGLITEISPEIPSGGFDVVFNMNGLYIVPGFVDVHVHLREPGFSYKETILTGTKAAARGGYCAVCTMPNVDPPPDSREHLAVQQRLIDEKAVVRVYPYGAITLGQKGEGELVDFDEIADEVIGFSDDGRGVQSEELMYSAMTRAAAFDKIIAAHCEDNSLISGGYIHAGKYAEENGHKGISSESEWKQVERDISLAKKTGCRYHVCHVSTKESVELIRHAKGQGVKVTCETAPHYLALSDKDLKDSGAFKMNPPIRSEEDKKALIEGICDGTIDIIATDHAPHSKEEKDRGLKDSLMGIVGLETAFPVLYTELVQKGIITFAKLIELMSVNPSRIFGIHNSIETGKAANLAVLDTSKQFVIKPFAFLSKGRSTPFEGLRVTGENVMTIVNGKIAWKKR